MMRKYIKNLPLFKKVLLFSFCITFMVVITTTAISVILQTELMKNELTDRVVGIASLWSATIVADDVERTIEFKDDTHPAYKRLKNIVSLVHEKNSLYIDGGIFLPEVVDGKKVFILIGSKNYDTLGLPSFSYYDAGEEYIDGFLTALKTGKVSHTEMFKDHYGIWITAFAPIKDIEGNVVAVLGIDVNAEAIQSFQKEIALYLFAFFLIITVVVYFILKNGLNKVMEPVNEIIKGINEVSYGNFDVKLQADDQSDLGLLCDRFNFMTNQLTTLFDRLSVTSEQFGKDGRLPNPTDKFEDAIGEMDNIIEKTRLLRELQRAEKMNAIGQLAASVAHEIRNPMTVVKGFLQIFLSKELSTEENTYIKLMIEELNRAETIINDYLSLAKPDLDEMEKVDAVELASKVMDLMNSYAMMSKNITLKTEFEDSVFIRGNVSELKQVLINIYKNGIEAMKDGGTLTVRVFKENHYGVFLIEDTGVGMTDEELARLGTAFYSLKEKGTGMGLMVCYQIIERMKGNIEVLSNKGVGSIFIIKVPLYKESD
ncbi:ATP-binding protein [Cytobacillus sp. FJAT-54145]|uniref:histidine kinase n=1 Tax=Cytobacillus spartinae TaxID=3299023 RepID=A0ABW6KCY9_9BACI